MVEWSEVDFISKVQSLIAFVAVAAAAVFHSW